MVKVSRQVGVHHIGEPLAEQSVHHLDRVNTTAARAVAIGCGFEVRLDDRLNDGDLLELLPPIAGG